MHFMGTKTMCADAVDPAAGTSPSHGRPRGGQVAQVLAGLACGLAIGVALGLLLAPQPGRDSRAWIAQRARAIVRQRGVRGLVDAVRSGPRTGRLDQNRGDNPARL